MAARRIVKEGRRYGLSAMIVSQRPSEIDTTIFHSAGRCSRMRLANASDRSQVTGTATDNLEGCSTCSLLFGPAKQSSLVRPFICHFEL